MSVHILGDNHLSAVLRFAFAKTWTDSIDREITVNMVQEAANELARVNDLSYATRYPDQPVDEFVAPVINWNQPLPTPLQFLKLLQNVEYQCEEAPDFYSTEAFRLIRNWKWEATTKLDGYNSEPWEID
jgi:hypothetical protein